MRRGLVSAVLLAALLGLLASGCGADRERIDPMPEPRDGRSGLQLSGTLSGSQLAVADGLPELLVETCELRHDLAATVCFATRGIDGSQVVVGLGNPEAMRQAERLPIAPPGCHSMLTCREVSDSAVVFLRVDEQIHRIREGTVILERAEHGERYVGQLRLRGDGVRLSGSFDVVRRPDPATGEEG